MRALIAAVAIFVASSCALRPTDTPCMQPPTTLTEEGAYNILRSAPRIWPDGWGFAGAPSCYSTAYRLLISSGTGQTYFERLFQHGTSAAKVYALAGMSELHAPNAAAYLKSEFARSSTPVPVIQGCVISEMPASSFAEMIDRGDLGLLR